LLAAKSFGLKQFPAIVISGLTEAEERRLRIADNKIALNAGGTWTCFGSSLPRSGRKAPIST